MTMTLTATRDIVATVAALPNKPYTVGFAAETRQLLHYAQDKLKRKRLDMIVANDVSAEGIGVGSDDNAVTLVWPDHYKELAQASKQRIAQQIITTIAQQFKV